MVQWDVKIWHIVTSNWCIYYPVFFISILSVSVFVVEVKHNILGKTMTSYMGLNKVKRGRWANDE